MFPLNFSICAENFFVLQFYQKSSEFGMMCMKYVQKTFLEGTFMHAPSFLVCARLMTCARTHARTQVRGYIY